MQTWPVCRMWIVSTQRVFYSRAKTMRSITAVVFSIYSQFTCCKLFTKLSDLVIRSLCAICFNQVFMSVLPHINWVVNWVG